MSRMLYLTFGCLVLAAWGGETRAQTAQPPAAVKDTNEIINTFREPPRTRGLRSLSKKERPAECAEAMKADDTATRSPAKKDRETLAQCTAEAPRLDFFIPFALNSSTLEPSAQQQLEQIGKALESDQLKEITFVIAGHTDRRGDRDYNVKLSQARADTVRHYLTENFAVAGRRLRAVGFGYERPKVQEDPYADANRRVELIKAE